MKECITHFQCDCLERKMKQLEESKDYLMDQVVEFDVLIEKLRNTLELVHNEVGCIFEGAPHYKCLIEKALQCIIPPPKSREDQITCMD